MLEHTKNTEQLQNEIISLRQENRALIAQLAYHRQVFKDVHVVLGNAGELAGSFKENKALQSLVEENEKLKNQMKAQRLSEREKEILRYIVNGYTSKEIALRLGISKLTVDTHRKHIQQKLDVSNTVELIKLALCFELIS